MQSLKLCKKFSAIQGRLCNGGRFLTETLIFFEGFYLTKTLIVLHSQEQPLCFDQGILYWTVILEYYIGVFRSKDILLD